MKRFLMASLTVLACMTLLSLCVAACAKAPTHLIWWMYSASGDAPAALQEVFERANAISAEEIGVTVDLLMKTDSQVSLDLNTGEYYDMIMCLAEGDACHIGCLSSITNLGNRLQAQALSQHLSCCVGLYNCVES